MTEQLPQKSSTPLIPANETERLSALYRYKILDTPPEAAFERITTLAARLFKMPIVLISLVDESRAWFKSCIGFDVREVPRDATLCSFAVLTDEPLIIPDTRLDERFACNPFVQSEPGVRFYAGAPLLSHDGFNLGTLCLLDTQPHDTLTAEQQATLVDLAAMVVDELELRLAAYKIAQVDAARRKSETQFRILNEALPLIVSLARPDGQIEYVNPYWITFSGRTSEDFANGDWLAAVHPEDQQAMLEGWHKALAEAAPYEYEFRARAADGTYLWLLARGVPVYRADGKVANWVNTAVDITEHKLAEEKLRESERFLKGINETAPNLLYIYDLNERRNLYVSPQIFPMLGVLPEDVQGIGSQLFAELFHPEDLKQIEQHHDRIRVAQEDEIFTIEYRMKHSNGEWRWLTSRDLIFTRDGQGKPVQILGSAIDITDRKQAEALLKASHNTFRHLVENSPFGVYVVDANFRLAQVSAGSQKVFENVRPLIGRDFTEVLRFIWPEPFASEAIALFQHTLETGEPYHAPNTIERRYDIGEVESYDWKIERITLPDGRFGVVCHFYDLSERQRYEAALRESEEQFRNLANSSPVLIWQTDKTGATFVNRYYLEFFAQTLDGVKGMGWANFLHPNDAAAYVSAYRAAFERQERYEFQCRFLRHDGEYRWLQSIGEPHYGLNRTFLGLVGCSVDVTDIKAVEAELQASEERFRNMADNSPMMIWVTNPTGYCTYLSRSWYDFTGQTEKTGLGFGWLEATHPDERQSSQAIFLAANERQEAFQLEYRLRHRDGRYRTCIDAAKPWFGVDGKFMGYIGSVIDIDERKQAERELQQQAVELTKLNKALEQTTSKLSERNQELDRFVYTVSHDLKAPLRAIYNLSQWIADDLEGQLEEENLRQMQLLQSRVVRMEALINGLLAYSRIGRTEIATERVKVGELLSEILDSLTISSTFTIFVQPEMPTLFTKRLLLSQVFSNLIS